MGAGQMVQPVNAKPDDLSLMTWVHMQKKRNDS